MKFEIRIVRQGWIDDDSRRDLCSHGEIDLRIGGQQVSAEGQLDEQWSYGISEAALGMLRTLRYRHTARDRVAERLIPHGCGTVLMMGCNIGIDWAVRHHDSFVHISDVVRYDSNDVGQAIRFPDVSVQIPWSAYATQVTGFATAAREFFRGIEKDRSSESVGGEYDAFWGEFNELLDNWQSPCERDIIRIGSYVEYHP